MMARLSTEQAQTVALHHFGINGQVTELGGERTQNFRIVAADRTTFTLKVSDPRESAECILLESAALLHIAKVAPDIAVPRIMHALNGELSVYLGAADGRRLRILTYLDGTPFSFVEAPTSALRNTIGWAVGTLDNALASFDHPFARQRDLIWDVKNISRLRPHLQLIDAKRRPLAEAMLDRFEAVVSPRLAHLPTQAIHSDMNGQNILIGGDRMAGFIDFGDLVHAPRLVDLAGATLLQFRDGENDVKDAADVVAAYNEAAPLTYLEVEFLQDFMIARCIINVLVTEYLADQNTANRDYIMKNNHVSWKRLVRLSCMPQNLFKSPS